MLGIAGAPSLHFPARYTNFVDRDTAGVNIDAGLAGAPSLYCPARYTNQFGRDTAGVNIDARASWCSQFVLPCPVDQLPWQRYGRGQYRCQGQLVLLVCTALPSTPTTLEEIPQGSIQMLGLAGAPSLHFPARYTNYVDRDMAGRGQYRCQGIAGATTLTLVYIWSNLQSVTKAAIFRVMFLLVGELGCCTHLSETLLTPRY